MKGKTSLTVRKYLVSVYVTQGYKAAAPLAIKYGYAPRYLYSMARQILGNYRKISYRRNPFIEFESYRFDPRFTVRTTNETPHHHTSSQEGIEVRQPQITGQASA